MVDYVKKKVDQSVNVSKTNPLSNFAWLLGATGIFILLIFIATQIFSRFVSEFVSLEDEVNYFGDLKVKDSIKYTPGNGERVRRLVGELWAPYDLTENLKLHVDLVESDHENAFITIGGNISVTSELLRNIQSENELAFVLCHEIGHFYNRDVIRGMSSGIVWTLVKSMVGLGGSDLAWMDYGVKASQLQFSREQESKADTFSIQCMQNKYGHIQGFDGFFNRVAAKSGFIENSKILSYMSTHPQTEKRIKSIQEMATDMGVPLQGELTSWN